MHLVTKMCLALLLFDLAGFCKSFGQGYDIPLSPWLMPGVSHQFSNSVDGILQLGWNPQQDLYIVYGQVFIRINKYIRVNPSYLLIKAGAIKARNQRDELALLNGLIFKVPIKKFEIESRQLIWNRFSGHHKDQHLVRNRIRVIMASTIKERNLRIYIFDELSFHINRGDWSRNRAGLGASLDLPYKLNFDISCARQRDFNMGKLNIAFIMVTMRI